MSRRRRAEHGVDERMRDHVPVGVPGQPARMIETDTAEDERNSLDERVRVHAQPDAKLAHPSGSCRALRPSKTVTV